MAITTFIPTVGGLIIGCIYMFGMLILSLSMVVHSYYVVFVEKRLDKTRVKYGLLMLALFCLAFQFLVIAYAVFYFFVANVVIDYPLSAIYSIERLLMLLIFIKRLTNTFETTVFVVAKNVKVWLYIGFGCCVVLCILISYSNETNHAEITLFISAVYYVVEITLAISILVAFARRLFTLMKMCANDNIDLDYKSSLYSNSSGNVFDDNFRNDHGSEQNVANNTQNSNAGNVDNSTGDNGNVASPKKKAALNADQMEYLHLMARLTLVNFITILSGQLSFYLSIIVTTSTKQSSIASPHPFAVIVCVSLGDIFCNQLGVYFAFSFSLKAYQKLCSFGHHCIYNCCLSCVDNNSCCCPQNTANLHHMTSLSLNKP